MTDRPLLRTRRPATLVVLMLVVLLATLLFGGARPAGATGAAYYVSASGADTAPGTVDAPFRTVGRGLVALRPGDTLYVRGGTYQERIKTPVIAAGRIDAPIRVQAFPGERPVIEGLLWLRNASHWTIDGLNVTWSEANAPTEHMVKMIDGIGWSFVNSEIWGARSFAGMLVVGTTAGQPSNWRVADNCIHDTYATNSTNQDQLMYVNTGVTAGPGVIERNLLFNAANGMGVKLGGPASVPGGAANVTMRWNTVYNTAQNVLVSWDSHSNVISSNLFSKVGTNYGNIRGYQLIGANNVAVGNVGGDARLFLLNDSGYAGVVDGGNTFPVDPRFDDTSTCAGFHPSDPVAASVGRWAGLEPAATPVTSVEAPTTTIAAPTTTTTTTTTAPAPEPEPEPTFEARPGNRKGYRMVASDGGIFAFGDAGFYGSTGDIRLNQPIVGMASTPSGEGYWLVASDGGIFSFGDAGFFGSTGAMRLNQPILGMAATPSGKGYWLTASDGGIFAFGDAGFFGSTGAMRLNRPITAMSSTPTGRGYWLTASDGGIFAFGDADFHGSTGDRRLTAEIVGMATAPDGAGYWLAGADGSVFAFGSAPDLGSAHGLSAPITDIARSGNGYWLAGLDGSLHAFGDATSLGSMAGTRLSLPVVGMASLG